VTIQATNPTDKPVGKDIWVSISSISLASRMSRRPMMPQSLWRNKCSINLNPGETKTVTLDTSTKLPSGTIIRISMTGNKQAVVGARLPVVARPLKARAQIVAKQGK